MNGEYCAFTKAVEHLGDRWSLVIVRDLMLRGALGFNALADGLPGISRSVLASRLRKLEDLGLVERDPRGRSGDGYRLTYAGQQLRPVLSGLREWSERFVPEDPAMIDRDPDVVIMWLARRFEPDALPPRRAVVELEIRGTQAKKGWLVVERGQAASVCVEDPCLAPDRYVFVSSDVGAIDRFVRGVTSWGAGVADGLIEVYGAPDLIRALPTWLAGAPLAIAS